MAMQLIDLFCAAVSIRFLNVFSAKGQPQCRRNVTMVGLPSGLGSCNFEVVGAFDPIEGTDFKVSTFSGDSQEWSSCWKVITSVSIEKRALIIL